MPQKPGLFRIAADLTNLFLSIPGPILTLDLWRTLAGNRLPPTRCIYHQRIVNLDHNSSQFEEEEGIPDLSLLPENIKELESAREEHPLAQLNLSCLGPGLAVGSDCLTVTMVWLRFH